MHRLLVPSAALAEDSVVLPREAARHLKVLRPRSGESIELFDGRGRVRTYVWSPEGLRAVDQQKILPPSPFRLTLFACVTKGSRWDWTIEKAVELGVSRIVPVISDRCIVRLAASERPAKAERWMRIAEDAARQSDAVWLPEILQAVDFPEALSLVRTCDHVYVGALTNPPPPPLLTAIPRESAGADLGFFVGPEGDFTPMELTSLLEIATPVSLGPTILRAETAAIYGVAVLAAVANRS